MKNLAAIVFFLFALLSLGMAFEFRADVQPLPLRLEAAESKKPAADAGPTRGRPGEDDTDEEDEEDLRAPPGGRPSVRPHPRG